MAEVLPSTSSENTELQPENEDIPDPDDSKEIVPEKPKKPLNMSPGAVLLRSWLNKSLRIKMSDGRVLIGIFLCTDRDANVILGSCSEYLPEEECEGGDNTSKEEPRVLGLVMVPGKHIVNISIDSNEYSNSESDMTAPLSDDIKDDEVM